MSYEDRLQKIGLTALEDRGKRGDVIVLFNYVIGRVKFNRDDFVILNTRRTREHK